VADVHNRSSRDDARKILAGEFITQSDCLKVKTELECGPVPNVMATLPNIGGTLCSTLSLADAHY